MNATTTTVTKDFTKYGILAEQAKRIWDLEQDAEWKVVKC